MASRFDIHFQALSESEQVDSYKFISFGFSPAVAVKGFQMVINMWMKCFLTPKGTDPTDVEYGTEFARMIGSNLPLADARDVGAIAVDDCNEQITLFQRNDDTLTRSERLASAEITDFIEDPDAPGFSMYVEIKNQANERLVLSLPVLQDG